jgi:BASS family bile acid:Na+ symporter
VGWRRRSSRRVSEAVLPLALLAGLAALVRPSDALAENSELILALLVLFTALGITPEHLPEVGRRWRLVVALSVVPMAVLAPIAWAISRLFASPTREGVLVLGLAPTEVAAGGLAALAGGDAALALAAVSGSLVISAIAGPLVAATLGDTEGLAVGPEELLIRFILVVIVPLILGAGARVLYKKLDCLEAELSAAGTLTVATLVYAALSGADGGASLGPALLGSIAFLAVSAVLALAWARAVGVAYRTTVPLAVGMRDFAVAAAMASEAFGPPAAAVAGVYGVLVLVAGAAVATVLRRSNPESTRMIRRTRH